jgi:hypothetical protein
MSATRMSAMATVSDRSSRRRSVRQRDAQARVLASRFASNAGQRWPSQQGGCGWRSARRRRRAAPTVARRRSSARFAPGLHLVYTWFTPGRSITVRSPKGRDKLCRTIGRNAGQTLVKYWSNDLLGVEAPVVLVDLAARAGPGQTRCKSGAVKPGVNQERSNQA